VILGPGSQAGVFFCAGAANEEAAAERVKLSSRQRHCTHVSLRRIFHAGKALASPRDLQTQRIVGLQAQLRSNEDCFSLRAT